MSEVADSSSTAAPVLPPPATAPSKGPFARLIGALFSPGETFEDIARKPDVLVPILVFVLIGYACTVITVPRMTFDTLLETQHEAMRKQNPQMTDKDFESVDRITMAFTKVMTWLGPLVGVVMYLVFAGVFYLVFRMFGGQGTFKQALSATLYAWVPMILFSIVMTVVIAMRGTFDPIEMPILVKSNPAFLTDMKEHPVLFSFFSSLDVFTVWVLALMSFGYSSMSKLSRVKSFVIVFSVYFAWVFVKLGFAAMNAARMKA
jgi:hypothetical protein